MDTIADIRTIPALPGAPDTRPPHLSIDRGAARDLNSTTAFVALGSERPTALQLSAKSPDFARALDCLASAVLYEAGDDPTGQAAVAQVVINRMHHPAFPRTVCAVVYQGSERTTGCQFTFTCDGALQRAPPPAAWQRARRLAESFLEGRTEPSVGLATHYHTDWVHPYWSDSLDKIARVGSHLFFRWRGSWGRRTAFTANRMAPEPFEPKLAMFSDAHREVRAAIELTRGAPSTPAIEAIAADRITAGPNDHFIQTDAGGHGSDLAMKALDMCRGQSICKVLGWDRRAQVYGSPAAPLARSIAFLYVRDKRTGVEVVLWDCARYNRPLDMQCLSKSNRHWITFTGSITRAAVPESPQMPIAAREARPAISAPHDGAAGI